MENGYTVKIFMASPMDVQEERSAFREIIHQINESIGRRFQIRFEVIGWETDVTPDQGVDAQDVVNRQISMDYDIFVCLFKNRLGTPTGRSCSGTIEEYERALVYRCANSNLRIMGYFMAQPETAPEIQALKERMSQDGVLYSDVSGLEEFRSMVLNHFSAVLMEYIRMTHQNGLELRHSDSTSSVAVAIIDERDRILLEKRSASCRVGPGLWQIPGGKVDKNEKPITSALREIHEELNLRLDPERLKLLRVLPAEDLRERGKIRDMHLYFCRLSLEETGDLRLNEESDACEWVSLADLSFTRRRYLGMNQEMMEILFREIHGTESLEKIVHFCKDTESWELPPELTGIPSGRLMQTYGFLSMLGLTRFENGDYVTDELGVKLMEALVDLSRENVPLFADGGRSQQIINRCRLSAEDCQLLRQHREKALYSHNSLLAVLSSKGEIRNSIRDVCDVMVFGVYDGQLYVLLRWDFYSDKYQILSSGIRGREDKSPEDEALLVLKKRLDSTVGSYMNFLQVKTFKTYHFSAGSVDNDPILRCYNINAMVAFVRRERIGDFLSSLYLANEATRLAVEYNWETDRQFRKNLNFFEWCRVSDLMSTRTSYRGKTVQGFAELISQIGRADFMKLSQNAVPLTDAALSEDVEPLIAALDSQEN